LEELQGGLCVSSVTKFDRLSVSGEVDSSSDVLQVVTVKVNGVPVVETTAVPGEVPGRMKFSRRIDEMWRYLGGGDVVEVEHAGVPLSISNYGTKYIHLGDTASRVNEMISLIERGYIFDKYGRLRIPMSEKNEWQSKAFRTINDIQSAILAEFGYELFITYGTLLGCIREGDFIRHDNDIDMTYVSRHSDPDSVRGEFVQICSKLIDLGYRGFITRHGIGIKRPVYLDIFFSYFTHDGKYQIAYGYHGREVIGTNLFTDTVDAALGTHTVKVPRRSEELLAQLYGDGWRIPDPGFSHHSKSRKQDLRFLASPEQMKPVFWKQFYLQNSFVEGSTFARFISERIAIDALIVDIGCGQGRDSIHFAKNGWRVIGADQSEAGLDQARRLASEQGLEKAATFVQIDASVPGEIRSLLESNAVLEAMADEREIVVYMRFFLHAIPHSTQRIILESIVECLPRFRLAVEFRTDEDEKRQKISAPHYRRFLEPSRFVKEIEGYGLKVDYRHEGTGLSIYKEEDPHLCRIIAVKG